MRTNVPALFRWLSRKYPKIISPVIEEPDVVIDDVSYPADYSRPNPNGELDNLYLDMNGIVHPCSHPENRPPPATEDEMMLEVFKYTDRVVSMARPRKVLMVAVDGVAPRAKMNQQRSRRFRSARDAKDKDQQNARMLEEMEAKGKAIDDSIKEKRSWDTNVITPGTPFMDKLATAIRYWTIYKLNSDPGWKELKVIISDASVPGEGEHKIMEFVRSQRQSPHHNPNTTHAIYGLDADLIMLGLATHEPYFRVLREDVFFQDRAPRLCHICGQQGHIAAQCTGEAKVKNGQFDERAPNAVEKKPFIWLHVNILREYLELELYVPRLPFKFDLERAIDDWVFMCFFVGNDFLPHIPSLEIRENGIDILINIWRRGLSSMGGYLTTDGTVNLRSTEVLLRSLGAQEDQIFRRRRENDLRRVENQKRRKLESGGNGYKNSAGAPVTPVVRRNQVDIGPKSLPTDIPLFTPKGVAIGMGSSNGAAPSGTTKTITSMAGVATYNADQANKSAASFLKAQLLAKKGAAPQSPSSANSIEETASATTATSVTSAELPVTPDLTSKKRKADEEADDETDGSAGKKRKADNNGSGVATPAADDEESSSEDDDAIRFWEPGYKNRYYSQKFKTQTPEQMDSIRKDVVRSYIEGVSWVLLYYYQGCPSWTWFYPYHYAPFASDFSDIADMEIKFSLGEPFRPYEQLMGVLPAASSHTLPPVLRTLMTDGDSEIIDFYPEEFPIDMNGKKMSWQGVALLPFIDEIRLLKAVRERYNLLTQEELGRNMHGHEVVYVTAESAFGLQIAKHLYNGYRPVGRDELHANEVMPIHPKISKGLIGAVKPNPDCIPGGVIAFPLSLDESLQKDGSRYKDIQRDKALSAHYIIPNSKYVHKSMLLPGYKAKPKVVTSLGGNNGGGHKRFY
ncbi:XRN 5'-3' exonuclease N-terminus-domain-containing protein [Lipomyces tetrasporus]|uniref:5'-3' exoribonuclease n=1 Tax=Lipomyces tetrasporus TaxID=54092 RepID=A0AAD7QTF9_9ASCO|nr:XRN 5'-3' exonuclease N-terminus-domain-containing protein [Lipomyces tetrasporus]KAJ8099407.1 XRN 5'-3' exonuclease N-terminus-domain-containing protein [Lipomyces tetrasporus]